MAGSYFAIVMTGIFRSRALLSHLLMTVMACAQGTREAPALVLGSPDDTTKVVRLSDLCFAYRRVDGDSALMFGNAALALSRSLNYARGEAQACNDLAIILMDRSAYSKAESLLRGGFA